MTGDLLILAAPTYVERVAELFRSRPNERVDTFTLEQAGGRRAWRTRVADLRRAPYFMDIENEQVRVKDADGHVVRIDSFYVWRARPHPPEEP